MHWDKLTVCNLLNKYVFCITRSKHQLWKDTFRFQFSLSVQKESVKQVFWIAELHRYQWPSRTELIPAMWKLQEYCRGNKDTSLPSEEEDLVHEICVCVQGRAVVWLFQHSPQVFSSFLQCKVYALKVETLLIQTVKELTYTEVVGYIVCSLLAYKSKQL